MSSIPIIDLIAGLIFIYFLLAIVNNSCLELFSSLFRWKTIMLSLWMKKTIGSSVYVDHLTTGVVPASSTSYIEPKDFARTIAIQLFQNEIPVVACNATRLSELIKSSSFPEPLKKTLQNFVFNTMMESTHASTDFNLLHVETQIEDWFRTQMYSMTTNYKRKSMIFTLAFATVITVALNIDTLKLASHLYGSREARESLANRSYAAAKLPSTIEPEPTPDESSLAGTSQFKSSADKSDSQTNTDMVLLPLGWPDHLLSEKSFSFGSIIKKAGGLFMTVMAICLGAPFWFEVLGKIANLRTSLKPLEK